MASSSTTRGKLESDLREKLPGVDDCTMEKLLQTLDEIGVIQIADLEFVKPEKLTPPLKEVQARKLLKEYSGDFVSAREQYKLDKMDRQLKMVELMKGIEADKMKYKADMAQAEAEIRKGINENNYQIRNIAESHTNQEDTTKILGCSSYGAGFGAAVGSLLGPLGMAAGAVIGGAIMGGAAGLEASITREERIDRKTNTFSQQIAAVQKMNEEMADNLERKSSECMLANINQKFLEARMD